MADNRFRWPIFTQFWTFSPAQWVVAAVWNICEFLNLPMPSAPQAFGFIIGARGVHLPNKKDR